MGLVLNALCPFVAYQVLTRAGIDVVPALAVAAVFPVAGIARGWIRTRRPDPIGILTLVFIVLGIVVAFATNEPLVLLFEGSLASAVYGVVCLGSLLFSRPLLFYVGREVATGGGPVAVAQFDKLWGVASFRASQRLATVAWGGWGLAQALVRTAAALVLPIGAFLASWPVIDAVVTIALISWTVRISRRAAAGGTAEGGGATAG